MSNSLLLVLVVAAAVVAVAVVVLRARRKLRLPGYDWHEAAAEPFAGDRATRRLRYSSAREDAENLVVALTQHLQVTVDAAGSTAAEIAAALAADADQALRDLLLRLDAREKGLDRLTVVLYGRTKAGKSSLFFALSGEGFDGIGDGRQNFTREARHVQLGDVELIDSPGVSGVGSAPLETLTEEVIHQADVLVAQVTDDAIFAEDFERLHDLGASERPSVVALNVKSGNVSRLFETPSKVFRSRRLDPHIERLRAGLTGPLQNARIVPHHAYGAATARHDSDRRRSPQQLWENSRVEGVIDAIQAAGRDAVRFGRQASDEAIAVVCGELVDRHVEATDETAARRLGCEKSIDQIEGILAEVGARRSSVQDRLDAHYATAETELLEGLQLASAAEFRQRAEQALRPKHVQGILYEALEESAQLLSEKFEEFRADVRLVARLALGTRTLDALHAEAQAEQERIRVAKGRATRRKWFRLGATAVGAVATLAAAETVIGGALVGIAVEKAIGKLLPELEVPTEDVAHRVRRVRELISASRERAEGAFDGALNEQVIEQGRHQLVLPLQEQVSQLARLEARLAAGRELVEACAARATGRMRQDDPNPSTTELDSDT